MLATATRSALPAFSEPRVLDHPHVAVSGNRVLRHPEVLCRRAFRSAISVRRPWPAQACDAGDHARQQFPRLTGLQQGRVRRWRCRNEMFGILPCPSRTRSFSPAKACVGDHGRQERTKKVRWRSGIFWTRRRWRRTSGGVKVRTRSVEAVFGEQNPLLFHRLARRPRRPCALSVMIAHGLGLLAGSSLRSFMICGQACCLRVRRCRGRNNIFDSAIGDQAE